MDWSYVEKRGKITGLNMLYFDALCQAARLAEVLGSSTEANRLQRLAKTIHTSIQRSMWSSRMKRFVDCTVRGKPSRSIGEVTNAIAIWTGVATRTQARQCVKQLDGRATHLATGGPMMTRLTEALFRQRQDAVAFPRIDRYWGEMVRRGANSYWEVFDPRWPAGMWPHKMWSISHGWTSGIVSLLQKYVLGGQTMAAGGNAVAVDPQPGHLCEAEGVIPTAKGPVKIRWSKKGRQLRLDVKAPDGVKVKKQSKNPSV